MAESRALRQLIAAVNVTGGVLRLPSGCVAPKADEDWLDLGDVYLQACKELGVEPVIEELPEGEADFLDEPEGTSLTPDIPAAADLPKVTVFLESELCSCERFGPHDTLQQALETISRLYTNALHLHDGERRKVGLYVNYDHDDDEE